MKNLVAIVVFTARPTYHYASGENIYNIIISQFIVIVTGQTEVPEGQNKI